jgi:hypothetical protein
MNGKSAILRAAIAAAVALAIFGAGFLLGANKFSKPNSVIHVVTLKWTPQSTPEQQKAALEGVEKMAGEIPGIRRIWLKTLKVQSPDEDFTNAFAIEFENKAAFDRYAEDPAHRAWEKVYLPIRGRSLSHDITN